MIPLHAIAGAWTASFASTASMDPYPESIVPMTSERRDQLNFCKWVLARIQDVNQFKSASSQMYLYSTNLLLTVLWAISSSSTLALILLEQILRNLYIRSSLFKPWNKLGINPSYHKPSSNLHYFMRSWALPQVRSRQLNEKMFWEFKWRSNNHLKRLQFPWSTVSFKIFGMQCSCPPCILSSCYWATRSVFLYRSHRHHLTYFLFHQIAFDKDLRPYRSIWVDWVNWSTCEMGLMGCHWSLTQVILL